MSRADPITGEKLADDDPEAVAIRPFSDFLSEQAGGDLHAEVSEALHDVIAAVTFTGKPAALTLTVTVKPGARSKVTGQVNGVRVHGEVKTRLPRPESEESLYFVDTAGNLSRRNPEQPPLPGHPGRTGTGALTAVLKIVTAKELMEQGQAREARLGQEAASRERAEAEYRRGYRDGFVAAINGLDEAYVSFSHGHRPPSIHRAVEAAWRFWERALDEWAAAEAPEDAPLPFVPPPVFLPGSQTAPGSRGR